MCGISGIIGRDSEVDLNPFISQMNDLIEHRGPDGEGKYFGNNFALGHRRLSIIDLSNGGHQPMEKDDCIITYNGEIYNYIEVRDELQSLGVSFNSASDTEVILASYKQWGESCVERFNGMWSFVIYDASKNVLFCSRDRFGIKPFYYYQNSERFYFGSEIKQLLPFVDKVEADSKILNEYIITGIEEHSENTFFKGIKKLRGGNNLVYNLETHEYYIKRYFEIKKEDLSALTEEDAVENYKKQFEKAITLRLRSDVKVGTCLSGGLDSSSVAAMSALKHDSTAHGKFTAIHAKSEELKSDESAFAEQVVKHCDLEMHVIKPTKEEFKSLIDEVIYTQEEPFGSTSIFMQYFVMKKAREIGCIVMLDGQGGDETLLGYEKYYPAYIMSAKGLKRIKAFKEIASNSKLSKLQTIKYYYYFTRYKLRMKTLRKKFDFIKPKYIKNFQSDAIFELAEGYRDMMELQKVELYKTQLPRLLRYEDKNSMRNSIETRLPMIDFEVVHAALNTPDKYKIKAGWSKYILRKAIEKLLPADIVWRKNKLGFNSPEKLWMDYISADIDEKIVNSSLLKELIDLDKLKLNQLDDRRKWRLYNVAKWEEIYKVES